jgi:hypothetical protein
METNDLKEKDRKHRDLWVKSLLKNKTTAPDKKAAAKDTKCLEKQLKKPTQVGSRESKKTPQHDVVEEPTQVGSEDSKKMPQHDVVEEPTQVGSNEDSKKMPQYEVVEEPTQVGSEVCDGRDSKNERRRERKKRKLRRQSEKKQVVAMAESELDQAILEANEERKLLEENWRLNQVTAEGTLLGEEGEELHRKLGLTDGEKRNRMVTSIKGTVRCENTLATINEECAKDEDEPKFTTVLQQQSEMGWHPVNLGRSYVSDDTVYNLFAAVPARRKGIGTHISIGEGVCYLFDSHGRRFHMREVNNQLRFKARLCSQDGQYKEVELVHDTGAAANIIRSGDSELWRNPGCETVSMGGYTGERSNLSGGGDLCLLLKSEETTGCVTDEDALNLEDTLVLVAQTEEEDEESTEELVSLVNTRARGSALDSLKGRDSIAEKNEAVVPDRPAMLSTPVQSNREFSDLSEAEQTWIMSQVKSAASLKKLVQARQQGDADQKNTVDGQRIGIAKRVEVMKEFCRTYTHLTVAKLNRMVAEGDIKNGIELDANARMKDEAQYIGKATKTRVHKKRKDAREDPGKGFRAPFFMVELDLIDLTNDTKGNRWNYKWLLTCICKEYGTLKVYPLKGKDDVKIRWRQYKQYINVISPYVQAALGVVPSVMIVGTDRGSEFITTHGMRMGELDHELFKDDIYRWTPTAGDSNKLGKVERANRTIVENVNVMLRQGGAKNDMAYYAALMFETHYNCTPTAANVIGNGEAPFKTLGIPFDSSKHVRFFCPAFVKLPTNTDVWTGEKRPQGKLASRSSKCFVIGYGGAFSQGADHDGYKVLLPPSTEGNSGKVYSSNDVTIAAELEVPRSFLTGLTRDALDDEHKLAKRVFDLDRRQQLRQMTYTDDAEEPAEEGTVADHSRRMTAGTGVTGQMRYEMDEPGATRGLSIHEARQRLTQARETNKLLRFALPSIAKKRGLSGKRYDCYHTVTTFQEFDQLISEKKAYKADLSNDLVKGHLVLVDNPDQVEMTDDPARYAPFRTSSANNFQGGGDVEHLDNVSLILGPLENGEDDADGDVLEVLNCNVEDFLSPEFIGMVHSAAEKHLGTGQVPLWLALAVYSQATIWVDGRQQPYTVPQAMKLPEWEQWKAAVIKEITGFVTLGVWQEVPRSAVPKGTKILPGRMVLEIKLKDGKFDKCKARYVSRGDQSTHSWYSFLRIFKSSDAIKVNEDVLCHCGYRVRNNWGQIMHTKESGHQPGILIESKDSGRA